MTNNFFKLLLFGLLIILSSGSANLFAQNTRIPIPAKPNPPKLVNDFANLISDAEEKMLEQKLVQFSDSTSNQISVVIVNDLAGYEIDDYTYALGKIWGIGKADKDNGILFLISMADRKVRIEVGSGLEGAVPDITAYNIIEKVFKPHFKAKEYFAGINQSVDHLIAASKYEYKGEVNPDHDSSFPFFLIVILLMLFIFFMVQRNRNRGYYMSRRGERHWDNGPWIGGGPFIGRGPFIGGGGGGDSDFGGGGFGGFGGGDFSGGGASGDW